MRRILWFLIVATIAVGSAKPGFADCHVNPPDLYMQRCIANYILDARIEWNCTFSNVGNIARDAEISCQFDCERLHEQAFSERWKEKQKCVDEDVN